MSRTTKPKGSPLKKILLGAGGVVGVVGVAAAIAFLTLDPKALITEKKDALLKDVSTKIGRELTSGDVTARVGASLGATIQAIRLAGPARSDGAAAPAQLEIQQVDVQLSLLRALLSFGKDLHVERFTIDGLVVRAARDGDGTWDFQDILDQLASDAPADDEGSPTDTTALAGLRIANVMVRNGRVELNDAMLGRPLAISALNVGVSDVVLGDPLSVTVQANLEDSGKKNPIDIAVRLATLPKDLSFDPLPDVDVKAVVTDVDLGPWGGLVPTDVPGPLAGTLRTDLTAKLSKGAAVVDVAGTVMTRGLVLRDAIGPQASKEARAAAPRGTPLDLDVTVGLRSTETTLALEKLTLKGSGLDVSGSLTKEGDGLAGLKAAAVTASIVDVQKLLGALPPSLRGLPEEVRIVGPLTAQLDKKGDALTAKLGLDNAQVRYVTKDDDGVESTAFDKAPGKALSLSLNGKNTAEALTIDDFALLIDNIKLGGKIVLPNKDGEAITADVHSGAIVLSSLQGLVPPFKDAIGRGQKVEGVVNVDVNARSAGGKQEAVIALDMKNLDVNLASTVVRGSGGVDVRAVPAGGDVSVVAKADLDGLSIVKSSGGETTLNKAAGLPLRLDADVKKGATDATINNVKLVIGKSVITGKGGVKNMGQKGESLSLDFGVVDVAFNDLRQALPGASKLPAGGRLRGALSLKGALSAKGLGLDAKNLDIGFGSSAIKGTVSVDNFDAPVVDVDLSQVVLGFDDLRPMGGSMGDLPAGGRFDGTVKVKGDTAKSSTVKLDVKINRLNAGRSDLKGTLAVTNLDKPQFTMSTQSDFLDVDGLRAAFGGGDDPKASKKPAKDDNPHGLSRDTRNLLAGVNGKATLQAKKALVKDMNLSDFTGILTMTRGVAKFDKLDFGFYGGTVSASGTLFDLPAERTRYDIDFHAKNVNFGAFLADQTDMGKIFSGTVSPDLKVKGRGLAPGDFAITADGPAELAFRDLKIASLDILGPLNDAMKKTGKAGAFNAAAAANEKGLTLMNFKALTRFIGGKLKLEKPVEADTPFGKMKIEGATGLDAKLDFKSTLQLTPAMVKKMTGGKITPKSDIPVPMKIGGTWDKPSITGIEVDKLLVAIVGDAVKGAVDAVVGDKGKDVVEGAKDVVGDLLGGDKKKPKKKKK